MSEPTPEQRGEVVYDLFKRGSALLEAGDFAAAADPAREGPLAGAREDLDPRGARPRLLPLGPLRAGRARSSRRSSSARPVNDYAHFCLGRALGKTGRAAEARRHATLAACMRPDRPDYRAFRDRLRARLPTRLKLPHRHRALAPPARAGGRARARPPRRPAGRRAPRSRCDSRAGEARHARRAVPPEQHPRVDPVRVGQRVGLARSAGRRPAAGPPRAASRPPARRPRSRPTRRGRHGAVSPGQALQVRVDDVHRGHRERVRSAPCGRSSSGSARRRSTVDGETIAAIGPGLLVLLGVRRGDTAEQADRLAAQAARAADLRGRRREDEPGRRARPAARSCASASSPSTATRARATARASPTRPRRRRPSPSTSGSGTLGAKGGRFGAHMRISLVNDGPVTVLVDA